MIAFTIFKHSLSRRWRNAPGRGMVRFTVDTERGMIRFTVDTERGMVRYTVDTVH